MAMLPEKQASTQVVRQLAALLEVPDDMAISLGLSDEVPADGYYQLGHLKFVIEWKGVGSGSAIARAIEQVREYAAALDRSAIPLVAVPYMGETGRELCAQSAISWLDLSGNAHIVGPGLKIRIEGKPNKFKRRGRPSNVFAPKSSRITRWLLMNPNRFMSQREIARGTEMDEGFTSRIVSRLEEERLVVRNDAGQIKARDLQLLLAAWREAYSFTKHHIIQGHIAARSSEKLLCQIFAALDDSGMSCAATGLGAAWLMTQFAGFRIVTFYVGVQPTDGLLDKMGFSKGARGANTWLVVPNDEGVFHGMTTKSDLPCVHPVQVYQDLKGHPERASDAAECLRQQILSWRDHG
jgi:hypothetical protein